MDCRTHSHTEFLEREGIIAPAVSATRSSTKRDYTFNNQRFTPKSPELLCEAPHKGGDCRPRTSSALSQAPTIAASYTGRRSLRERIYLPKNRGKQHVFPEDEVNPPSHANGLQEVRAEKTRSRIIESLWTSRPRKLKSRHVKHHTHDSTQTASGRSISSPTDAYVPAPAPNFGDIPGFGFETPAPHVDLSSGAAARAAAAAQNELLESMRKMDLRGYSEVKDSESGIGIESAEDKSVPDTPLKRKGWLFNSICRVSCLTIP